MTKNTDYVVIYVVFCVVVKAVTRTEGVWLCARVHRVKLDEEV